MIAFLCLFKFSKIFFKVLLLCERDSIDTLQRVLAAVTKPIGTRIFHQLKCSGMASVRQVRACAQIDKVPHPVGACHPICRHFSINQVSFESVVAEQIQSFLLG